jgi:hypothetical protein
MGRVLRQRNRSIVTHATRTSAHVVGLTDWNCRRGAVPRRAEVLVVGGHECGPSCSRNDVRCVSPRELHPGELADVDDHMAVATDVTERHWRPPPTLCSPGSIPAPPPSITAGHRAQLALTSRFRRLPTPGHSPPRDALSSPQQALSQRSGGSCDDVVEEGGGRSVALRCGVLGEGCP